MSIEKEVLLSKLEFREQDFINRGKALFPECGIFLFDIYCISALNRSVNNIRGYISLIRDSNFIAAAPLVRIHLDTMLRLYGMSLLNQNKNDVSLEILKGTPLKKFKDRDGKYLTDSHLVDSIKEHAQFSYVKNLYTISSGFIHLSDLHILSSSKLGSKPGEIIGGIRRSDEFIPEKEKKAATIWMDRISEGILEFIDDWINQKGSYPKV